MNDLRLADLPPDESRELYLEARGSSKNNGVRRFLVVLAVLVGLMMVFGVLVLVRGANKADELDNRLTTAEQRADDNAGAAQALATQVEQLGQEPVVEAPSAAPGDVPTAATVTQDQVNAAVNSFFAVNPPAAPIPTAAEVTTAVATVLSAQGDQLLTGRIADAVAGYFATNPPLPGPQGEVGPSGAPGADGATGAQGPGPTELEIDAAVDRYCADMGGCLGPAGTPGEPPFSWTYTDLTGQHTCTRTTPDFDPTAPTYTCT